MADVVEVIENYINDRKSYTKIKMGSPALEEIRSMQTILNYLGFGEQLKWDDTQPDGLYGPCTAEAIRLFCQKNNLPGDGTVITLPIVKTMISRYLMLSDVFYLIAAINAETVEKKFYYNSPVLPAINALHKLLTAVGCGQKLFFDKYGVDVYYGISTAAALKRFAADENIPVSEEKITVVTKPIAQALLNKVSLFYGKPVDQLVLPPIPMPQNLTATIKPEGGKSRIYVGDGSDQVRFTRYKNGVYYIGDQTVPQSIQKNRTIIQNLGITPSALNIIHSVSENEGNLDAINTWDDSFLSFGIFQWTAGAGSDSGELAILLKKIKTKAPELFKLYFNNYGLDVIAPNNRTGTIILTGERLINPELKDQLRSVEWAYRFWKAGHDSMIQAIEIAHAASRIDSFYKSDESKPGGYYINQLITSEYGVALILDNHVNRPAYIEKCLETALKETHLKDPKKWETQQEKQLLQAYLEIRPTFGRHPMTNAKGRAEVIQKYLKNGIISDERGSFVWK